MIHKLPILFCANEHGFGNVTFPDLDHMDTFKIHQAAIEPVGIGKLRKDAKAAGWGRVNGEDYCPDCMSNM